MIRPWADQSTADIWASIDHPQFAPMTWLMDTSAASIKDVGVKLRRIKDPKKRSVHLWGLNHVIFNHPLDGLLEFKHGIAECKPIALAIARAIPAVAAVVLDNEDATNAWTLSNERRVLAAAKLGMAVPFDHDTVTAFNAVCHRLTSAAVREAIFDPLRKYLKNASYSNFNDARADALDGLTDVNGWPLQQETLNGTVCAPAMYSGKGLLPATQDPWSGMIFQQDQLRVYQMHAPGKLQPWIAGDNVDNAGSMKDSPYYREHILHTLLMSGGEALFFDAGQPDAIPKLIAIVDELYARGNNKLPAELAEAPRIATDAECVVTARAADSQYPGDEMLARVTFAPGVTKATVRLAGNTYTVQPDDSGVGCWILRAA